MQAAVQELKVVLLIAGSWRRSQVRPLPKGRCRVWHMVTPHQGASYIMTGNGVGGLAVKYEF